MIWEVINVDLKSIKILSDGPLPLLAAVYDQLNIGSKVDEFVDVLPPKLCPKTMLVN